MKRILAIVSCFVLLVGLSATVPVTAAEKETILLAGSDFQVSAHNTSRIEQVLGTLEMHGITKADGAFFCGDYTLNSCDENNGQSSAGLAVLKKLFNPIVGSKMTFVQGNHDPADTAGLSKSGNNDPVSGKYGVYVIHEDQYLQYDWDYSRGVVEETAAKLKQYLDQKASIGWTKPIFVLSHVGLHWGNRTIKEGSAIHGELLVNVLNEAGEKGLNIIFLYGHDHSGGIADFIGGSAVYFKKGDQIEVCTGKKKEHATRTIKFTYMNAGYIGYYSTTEPTCDATVTMSVFRIRGDEVIITRYDGNVNLLREQYGIHNLKSKGVWHPDYTQKGYHAEPNTLEYASSRKVTATNDVYVETPMPSVATTTTEYTTTTKNNGVVITKPITTTQTTQPSTTQIAPVTTAQTPQTTPAITAQTTRPNATKSTGQTAPVTTMQTAQSTGQSVPVIATQTALSTSQTIPTQNAQQSVTGQNTLATTQTVAKTTQKSSNPIMGQATQSVAQNTQQSANQPTIQTATATKSTAQTTRKTESSGAQNKATSHSVPTAGTAVHTTAPNGATTGVGENPTITVDMQVTDATMDEGSSSDSTLTTDTDLPMESTVGITQDTTFAVEEMLPTDATENQSEPTEPVSTETEKPWILTPGGIVLMVFGGVAIVAIPVGVVVFLQLRKKKEQ